MDGGDLAKLIVSIVLFSATWAFVRYCTWDGRRK